MSSPTPTTTLFTKRPEPHTIILARGERVRHWQVRTGHLMAGVAAAVLTVTFCVGASALFLLGDDVATAFKAREGRTVAAYEQRIAALRQQVDMLTTSQFVDRDKLQREIVRLGAVQEILTARAERLEPLFDDARAFGLLPDAALSTDPELGEPGATNAFAPAGRPAAADRFDTVDPTRTGSLHPAPASVTALPLIEEALRSTATVQADRVATLTDEANERRSTIEGTLAGLGVENGDGFGVGGPFVPYPGETFEAEDIDRLAEALERLEGTLDRARNLPLVSPLPGGRRSSGFGVRRDPFLGRKALHAGLDFAARTGTAVTAAAAGTVVAAGENGGYGLMVEIEHGDGFVTRYAHLSRIVVREGATVEAGARVGDVGSTGRSTGPHLHYEVRRDGAAVDPSLFLKAGTRIAGLLRR